MNQLLKRTFFYGGLSTISLLLANCSLISDSKKVHPPHETIAVPALNIVNESAITYRAEYGNDYENNGNVIAQYPHFDLTLFSKKHIPLNKGSIHTYELTSKDGVDKKHISCDTRHSEKKYFHLEGLHFYYHSNKEGMINIYMPSRLLAKR